MLQVTGLTKKFSQFVAVDEINFTLQKGDILGFLGPNGAGKSTTMKMLSGYLTPTRGKVTLNNKDLITQTEEVKTMIGYLPETVPLYKDMTVREFLHFIAAIRKTPKIKSKVNEILITTFLTDVSEQIIGTLSKGYRQRVGFAQAIIHNPHFLILDEPTDGLDPNQKQEVRDIIKGLSHDKAIILSTHILEEMEAVCNRVIIINEGKIAIDTTPNELLKKSNYYHNIKVDFKNEITSEIKEEIKNFSGVAKVVTLNKKSMLILPKDKIELLDKLLKLLQRKKIAINAIATHQGKADEVFRNLTAPTVS